MKKLKAAVIGLGNIGFKFDLDPYRKITWSHVGGYTKSNFTELGGVVEIDKRKVCLFKKFYKNIPVFYTIEELMDSVSIDIVSICTPTPTHYMILKKLTNYPIKAIFCEKPIATTLKEARDMVRICERKGIVLAVNHTRRWDNNYLFAKRVINSGQLGRLRAVSVIYSGQIFNIGTHLFDTVRMLISKDAQYTSGFFSSKNILDPDVSGWVKFEENLPCTVTVTGRKKDLVFDIDIIGEKGRICIRDNGRHIEKFFFKSSKHYSGYREPVPVPIRKPVARNDRFIDAIDDIVKAVERKKRNVNCSGIDGFCALSLSLAMVESAQRDGIPVRLKD